MKLFATGLRFLLTAIVGSCIALSGSIGAAAVTTNDWVPFDGVLENSCNGDTVALSGMVHVLNVTPNGQNHHFDFHLSLVDVHGVGVPSGETYVLNGQFTVVDSGNPNGVFVSQAVITSRLISNGPADNQMVMMTNHIAFDSEGNLKSFHSSVTESCSG